MEHQSFLDKISDSDMCLVGIGEDFDTHKSLFNSSVYEKGCVFFKQIGALTLLPAWKSYCCNRVGNGEIKNAVDKLAEILKEKNYFVISLSTNEVISLYPWKHGRIVSPCGMFTHKQCPNGHRELVDLSDTERAQMDSLFDALYVECGVQNKELDVEKITRIMPDFGVCPECGERLVLNNIYAENYVEAGYLPKWELYKKWLQGTVNRKLIILELGVGLKYPSVIRWPFEKVAFFNEKANLFRIHEHLPQLPPELAQKGTGISQNPIDWLLDL